MVQIRERKNSYEFKKPLYLKKSIAAQGETIRDRLAATCHSFQTKTFSPSPWLWSSGSRARTGANLEVWGQVKEDGSIHVFYDSDTHMKSYEPLSQ